MKRSRAGIVVSGLALLIFASGIGAAGIGPWGLENQARAFEEASKGSYGSITGQLVLEGEIPPRELLVMKGNAKVNDAAICAADDLFSDVFVVDQVSRGVADVFVYLPKVKEIHPRLKESANKEVEFDQEKCRFTPHSLIVRTDQAVVVKSKDGCAHNTRGSPLRNAQFNFAVAANDRKGASVKLKVAEKLPFPVECNIHGWMRANWLVIDHPYATISDSQGKFTIADLPAGPHEFSLWHEIPGFVERKYSVTVKAGETVDLGQIKVPVSKFMKK